VVLDPWREGVSTACSYRCPLSFNTEALKRCRYWRRAPAQFLQIKSGKLRSENRRKDIRAKTDRVAVRTLSWNICISRLSKVGWVSSKTEYFQASRETQPRRLQPGCVHSSPRPGKTLLLEKWPPLKPIQITV